MMTDRRHETDRGRRQAEEERQLGRTHRTEAIDPEEDHQRETTGAAEDRREEGREDADRRRGGWARALGPEDALAGLELGLERGQLLIVSPTARRPTCRRDSRAAPMPDSLIM